MSHQTRLSAKGQVVIPKDVRDRLHWTPGTELEVVQTPGGVTLRQKRPEKSLTVEKALERIGARVKWNGPIYDDRDIDEALDRMFREDYRDK